MCHTFYMLHIVKKLHEVRANYWKAANCEKRGTQFFAHSFA